MAGKKKTPRQATSGGVKWMALAGKALTAARQYAADGKTAEQISDYFNVNLAWVEDNIMNQPESPPVKETESGKKPTAPTASATTSTM